MPSRFPLDYLEIISPLDSRTYVRNFFYFVPFLHAEADGNSIRLMGLCFRLTRFS